MLHGSQPCWVEQLCLVSLIENPYDAEGLFWAQYHLRHLAYARLSRVLQHDQNLKVSDFSLNGVHFRFCFLRKSLRTSPLSLSHLSPYFHNDSNLQPLVSFLLCSNKHGVSRLCETVSVHKNSHSKWCTFLPALCSWPQGDK